MRSMPEHSALLTYDTCTSSSNPRPTLSPMAYSNKLGLTAMQSISPCFCTSAKKSSLFFLSVRTSAFLPKERTLRPGLTQGALDATHIFLAHHVEAIKIEIDQRCSPPPPPPLLLSTGLLGERLCLEMGCDSVMILVVPGECGEEAHLGESRRGGDAKAKARGEEQPKNTAPSLPFSIQPYHTTIAHTHSTMITKTD